MTRLLPIPEAAAILGLPERSLLRAAEQHGHLVRVGRALRLLESELPELIDKCRSQPKAHALSCDPAPVAPPSGLSRTPANPNAAQAQRIADKLKASSRNTLAAKRGEVVPLARQK